MRLSDYRGEDAIELLADIIEPASEIFGDTEFRDAVRGGASKVSIVKMVLKKHKKEVLHIMATIDGEDPDEYMPNVLTLPVKLIDMLNDEEFMQLFQLQGQTEVDASSGSAMGSTEENVK